MKKKTAYSLIMLIATIFVSMSIATQIYASLTNHAGAEGYPGIFGMYWPWKIFEWHKWANRTPYSTSVSHGWGITVFILGLVGTIVYFIKSKNTNMMQFKLTVKPRVQEVTEKADEENVRTKQHNEEQTSDSQSSEQNNSEKNKTQEEQSGQNQVTKTVEDNSDLIKDLQVIKEGFNSIKEELKFYKNETVILRKEIESQQYSNKKDLDYIKNLFSDNEKSKIQREVIGIVINDVKEKNPQSEIDEFASQFFNVTLAAKKESEKATVHPKVDKKALPEEVTEPPKADEKVATVADTEPPKADDKAPTLVEKEQEVLFKQKNDKRRI